MERCVVCFHGAGELFNAGYYQLAGSVYCSINCYSELVKKEENGRFEKNPATNKRTRRNAKSSRKGARKSRSKR